MGGKKATSTSQVSIPPEVLARYNAINARAETAASKPFQAFGSNPADYVAQMNDQQGLGTSTINASGGPASAGIDRYMSPYIKNVADTTGAYMRQQQEQAQSGALGTAASSGAFGGDRAGIAAANLQQQNQMAYGKTMADIMNQGYTQALGASQADLNRGLQAGQMQLAAGTMQQQTEQAGKDAMRDRFMQEQGLPYQQAQFLANIALGTGAASGSTTTSTSPVGFFQNLATGGKVEGYAEGGGVAGPVSHSREAIGGVGYVPEADLPVGQLMIAQPPEKEDNGSGDKIAQILAMIGGGGKKDGGAIDARHGYDLGGTPTNNPEWIKQLFNSIPGSLASVAGYSGAGGGGLAAADAAAIAARERRAVAVPDDPYNDKILQLLKASGPTIPYPQAREATGAIVDEFDRATDNPFGAPFNNAPAPVATTPAPVAAPQGGVVPAPAVPAVQPQPRLSFGSTPSGVSNAPSLDMGTGVAGNAPQVPAATQQAGNGVAGNIVQAPLVIQPPTRDAMADPFGYAVGFTLQSEGGFNPNDSNGAPVNFGINQAYHPEVDVSKITKDQATQIYRRDYWEPINGDALAAKDPQLARAVFDTAVMSGVGTANDLLAKSGGDTNAFLQLRADYLSGLVRGNPEKYGKYAAAWNNRTIGLGGPNMMTEYGETGIGDTGNGGGLAAGMFDNGKPYEERNGLGKFFHDPQGGLSKNALLSTLSGLGAMASSRSISPFTAILQGLGAGADTYNTMQNQEPKRVADILANNATARMQYQTQIALGEKRPFEQWAKDQFENGTQSMAGGQNGSVSPVDQAVGGGSFMGVPLDKTGGGLSIPIQLPDGSGTILASQSYAYNSQLAASVAKEASLGIPFAVNTLTQAKANMAAIEANNGQVQTVDGKVTTDPTFNAVQFGSTKVAADTTRSGEIYGQLPSLMKDADNAIRTNQELTEALQGSAGVTSFAPLLNKVGSIATGLGISKTDYPDDYQFAYKVLGQEASNALNEVAGKTDTSVYSGFLTQSQPTPEMAPGAIEKILAIRSGTARFKYDLAKTLNAAAQSGQSNLAEIERNFEASNPLSKYVEEEMPKFEGKIPRPSDAPQEGATSTSGGKPIIFTNGQWEYQ
jgi:hypothetical protein